MLTFLLQDLVADDGVVDGNAGEVVVVRVVPVQELIRHVRHVEAGVTLARNVDLAAMGVKGVDERLVESGEFLGQLKLVGDVRLALRKANANGLSGEEKSGQTLQHAALEGFSLNPKHVRQVHPGVRVLHRSVGAGLPREGAVLGQETAQRTAAGAAIEPARRQRTRKTKQKSVVDAAIPDGDLVGGVGVGRREEPVQDQ